MRKQSAQNKILRAVQKVAVEKQRELEKPEARQKQPEAPRLHLALPLAKLCHDGQGIWIEGAHTQSR
jgi:hypothetical protein